MAIFARKEAPSPHSASKVWITAKNGQAAPVEGEIRVNLQLDAKKLYQVTDLFSGQSQTLSGKSLLDNGFKYNLPAYGSSVYWLEAFHE